MKFRYWLSVLFLENEDPWYVADRSLLVERMTRNRSHRPPLASSMGEEAHPIAVDESPCAATRATGGASLRVRLRGVNPVCWPLDTRQRCPDHRAIELLVPVPAAAHDVAGPALTNPRRTAELHGRFAAVNAGASCVSQ